MRTERTNGSTTYTYTYDGTTLAQMTVGNNTLIFAWGANGHPMGVKYNGTSYYYVTNALGDVVAIVDNSGTEWVTYTYDAWGNVLSTGGNLASTLGKYNPLRYRGYVYDEETKLYYLQSRYYNPDICRFISADSISYLGADGTPVSYNLFAYCNNNPVMYSDPTGHMPEWLAWIFSGTAVALGIVLCATGFGGIAGGVLIGAGAGSLINGYMTKAAGGDFTAGYIGGAISGALCGVGAGLGGLAFSAASEATNIACLGFLALGAVSSFTGGFVGNLAGAVYTNWHHSGFKYIDINWRETIATSTIMGALNIFAGIGSGMATIVADAGINAVCSNTKFAARLFAGAIAGGTEALYDLTSYLINRLIVLP